MVRYKGQVSPKMKVGPSRDLPGSCRDFGGWAPASRCLISCGRSPTANTATRCAIRAAPSILT
jgi:hypothetical protein